MKLNRRALTGAALFALLSLGAVPLGEVFTICQGTYASFAADVVYNSVDHEYFVVSSGPTGLLGQRIKPDGTMNGAAIPIELTAPGHWVQDPVIAYASTTNRYLVAFTEGEIADPATNGNFGRVLDAQSGADTGGGRILLSATAIEQVEVASDGSGFALVWTAVSGDAVFSIQGRLLDDDGTPVGAAFPIRDDGAKVFTPAIAYLGGAAERYLVVYVQEFDAVQSIYPTSILGQVVTREGLVMQPQSLVSSSPRKPYAPRVAANPKDLEWLVVWDEELWGFNDALLHADMMFRRADATGTPVGTASAIATYNGEIRANDLYNSFPDVTWCAADNTFVIQWVAMSATNQGFDTIPCQLWSGRVAGASRFSSEADGFLGTPGPIAMTTMLPDDVFWYSGVRPAAGLDSNDAFSVFNGQAPTSLSCLGIRSEGPPPDPAQTPPPQGMPAEESSKSGGLCSAGATARFEVAIGLLILLGLTSLRRR